MLDKIISAGFYLLFFLTPLIWTQYNHELFEYNKMLFVYSLTVIIVTAWVVKMLRRREFLIKRSFLDIFVVIFLIANILSTFFSIDPHTSWWGYYSRSNGGLLSIISYTLLYFAYTTNIAREKTLNYLKMAVFGGGIVALYAIPEHFGVSPSCVILNSEFSANCWVQDVKSRVFATLGQPNWLAGYLAMLIFPAIYFLITVNKIQAKIFYFLIVIFTYMAFTFTFSRGGALGLIVGFLVFLKGMLVVWGVRRYLKKESIIKGFDFKIIGVVLTCFLIINLLFGSALTRFKLISDINPIEQGNNQTGGAPTIATVTQLENGGTESGQIRLIVWKGALEIFKHYPTFGSGVETFAYAYYNFRPVEHNLVSEWDFLYNKAHNEFLNYLANTGSVGFLSYLGLILGFIFWNLWKILSLTKIEAQNEDKDKKRGLLLLLMILSSLIAYHVQNFFGFSVVILAVFFYLFPAIALVYLDDKKSYYHLPRFLNFLSIITKRDIYINIFSIICFIVGISFLITITRIWYADTIFAKGSNYVELGNVGQGYNYLSRAVDLNEDEPLFKSELAFAAASAAVALAESNATRSATLKEEAIELSDQIIKTSPNNVSFWRTLVRTYYQLAGIDNEYSNKTVEALDRSIKLAPTDAKLYYNKALVLGQMDRINESIEVLKKAVELKPNYREAHIALALFYHEIKDDAKAKEELEIVLKLVPNDPEALDRLKEWKLVGED